MRLMRSIPLLAILFVVFLLTPCRGEAVCRTTIGIATARVAVDGQGSDAQHAECLRLSSTPLFSTITSHASSQSVTPLVRVLPRAVRSVERVFQYSKAVSAIDSSTAAQRYGLYNHRILFVSLARHYYLARAEILRI